MAIIGIDATALSVSACGGIGTSQYQTMRALAGLDLPHRFVVYAASPPLVPFTKCTLDLPWPVRLGSGLLARSNILWMQTGVNRLIAADRPDVFWGPRHLLPFRARGIGTVATVHDFWDRHHPEQQRWVNRTANRLLVNKVIARADVVVVPSSATAAEVVSFGHPAIGERIRVVPWGVDREVFQPLPEQQVASSLARLGIASPYLLCLDVFNRRKNFSAVLDAVSRVPEEQLRPLGIVGIGRPRRAASAPDLIRQSRSLGLSSRLKLLGGVSTQDLVALYAGALAFVYPSFYEGFGMPVLEAMACGCPVIATRASSVPEVAGDAAVLVDPTSARQIAEAIMLVARDDRERERLVASGAERVKYFTWQRTAEAMLGAFEQALAARAGCPS